MTNVQKQNFCNKPLLNHSSKSTQDFTKATLPWKLVQGLSPCDIFFESTNIVVFFETKLLQGKIFLKRQRKVFLKGENLKVCKISCMY